jgi:hypothetical protein
MFLNKKVDRTLVYLTLSDTMKVMIRNIYSELEVNPLGNKKKK